MERTIVFCIILSWSVSFLNATCSLGIIENGVGQTDQNTIVNKHNALRLLLAQGKVPGQPRAINLLRMSYDAKLAEEAQKIANTCEFKHVKVNDGRFYVGQNLYMTMSTSCDKGSDWNGAIQSWFDEYKLYRYPDPPNEQTGHYTQVAWAESKYVGCGYTMYNSSGKFKCSKLYVCNYGPGGNINGRAPYKTGSGGCNNLC